MPSVNCKVQLHRLTCQDDPWRQFWRNRASGPLFIPEKRCGIIFRQRKMCNALCGLFDDLVVFEWSPSIMTFFWSNLSEAFFGGIHKNNDRAIGRMTAVRTNKLKGAQINSTRGETCNLWWHYSREGSMRRRFWTMQFSAELSRAGVKPTIFGSRKFQRIWSAFLDTLN